MNDAGTGLSRLLFAATLIAAGLLGGAVVAAPYALGERTDASDLLILFARDMTVRRTAFFCAIGLVATAFIFFRPAGMKRKRRDPASAMTGA